MASIEPKTPEELLAASWIPHDTAARHLLHAIRKRAAESLNGFNDPMALHDIIELLKGLEAEAPPRDWKIQLKNKQL